MTGEPPSFSIIIPTYARPGRVRSCLHALGGLAYPADRFEVIVVDDGSPASPRDEVEAFKDRLDVKLLTQPNRGPGAARNRAAQEARGRFLAFTADDCAPRADWLTALQRRLEQSPDRLVGGAICNELPHNPCSTASHLLIEYMYGYFNRDPEQARFFTPNNLAVAATEFRAAGGFNPRVGATGEDREFCHRWRCGGRGMVFAPEAVVRHAHPLSLAGYVRQQYNYGVGSCRYRKALAPARADGGAAAVIPEPLRFYLNLVRFPLRRGIGPRAWMHAALLGLGQVANAAGVLREQLRIAAAPPPVPSVPPTELDGILCADRAEGEP